MKNRFNVGDQVCVRPTSYINLSKNFFNSVETWNDSSDNDTTLMLGGSYSIKSVIFQGNQSWYSLLSSSNMGLVGCDEVIALSEKKKCPLKRGDLVRFASLFSIQDLAFLQASYGKCYDGFGPDKIYEIVDVINELYIFLKYEKNNPCAFPFLYEHVVEV